jgi:hypothetical protein
MERSKASLRVEYAPLIAAFLANGGRVAKFDPRGQRIA